MKSFEQQIAQTLEENDSFNMVRPNTIVSAATATNDWAQEGFQFAVLNDIIATDGFSSGTTLVNSASLHGGKRRAARETVTMVTSIKLPGEIFHSEQEDNGKVGVWLVPGERDVLPKWISFSPLCLINE